MRKFSYSLMAGGLLPLGQGVRDGYRGSTDDPSVQGTGHKVEEAKRLQQFRNALAYKLVFALSPLVLGAVMLSLAKR